ncbi:glycosyltransferase family 2 protein [Bifidobacterium callimiconis]|uniref:Glycosyl transferase family 2 n=1 Tax=Bifidobacterium callimiconis TaxID=2306973 RepID=A0A430FEF1_9BIFI|nr:glycosyltransferase family 2 protein [Bifidobacterium callimiconis]RSX51148.1 glycosyl transferase family 2 [Bifidobacterium callimiconis]
MHNKDHLAVRDAQPLVSVIVPVYKVERQLDRCVTSLIGQSYRNLEIILVDDGSPDGCPQKCDEWASKDPRVSVIHQSNGGLSAARNTGIDAMTGEYVAFVDSDDYVEPDYIRLMLEAAQANNAEVVICSIHQEDDQTVASPDNHTITDHVTTLSGRACLARLGGDTVADYVTAWNKLYAARLWKTIRFPVGKLHEDEFTTYRILAECATVVLVPDSLYHYVQNAGSIMHTEYSIRNLDRIEAWAQRLRFYRKRGYTELYAVTFNLITWDMPHAVKSLDWNDPVIKRRLREIFSQIKPFSPEVMAHMNGIKPMIAYLLICLCPFRFCQLRYGR